MGRFKYNKVNIRQKVILMDKKGQMMGMMGGMKIFSIVFALILIAVGLIPMLSDFGMIGFTIPEIPMLILRIIIIVGGVMLLIDSFRMAY